jgi:hypothetical protein
MRYGILLEKDKKEKLFYLNSNTSIFHGSEAFICKEKLLNFKKSDASCSKAVHLRLRR